ncbi:MAG: rod shape-determining protein MreC [Patescibacteria group bacterium]
MPTLVKFWIISFLILALNLTPLKGFYASLKKTAHIATEPIQLGLFSVSLEGARFVDFFVNLKNIRGENLRLREETLELKSLLSKYKEQENENKILKEQLQITNNLSENEQLVKAGVIGLPYDSQNSEVVVNAGLEDGIGLGDNVIYKNFLVGSVVDVFNKRAIVMLITSPKLSVAVVNQTKNGRAKGLVVGRFGTSLLMDRILPDEDIEVGDVIVTSGQDGVFKSGLIVGQVVGVEEAKAEPLKRAILETEFDMAKLEQLFIVKKNL